MIRLTVFFYSLAIIFCIHLQSQQNKITVKDVLNAACPYLPTAYITNQDSNWIYGRLNTTIQKIKAEELRNGNKVVKCPIKKPYSNGVECINCAKNQVFNLKTKTCEYCPKGTQYNSKVRKCMIIINANTKVVYFTDFDHEHIVANGRPFQQLKQQHQDRLSSIPQSYKKACDSTTPFFNGENCISCPKDQPYFDIENLTCVSPQKGTRYSAQTHKFVQLTASDQSKTNVHPTIQRYLMNIK